VQYKFGRIGKIAEMAAPTFVFAHFLTPHPDYVFESNGDFLTVEETAGRSLKTKYTDQLQATNKMVKSLVDTLLAHSDSPPIIILQADEGPFPKGSYSWRWDELTEPERRQKIGILNAYYFPGGHEDVLYESISPVNSFRVVFNLYFGADLELLPDRHFVYDWSQPYVFHDVTDNVT
jgi:hypothetical protein